MFELKEEDNLCQNLKSEVKRIFSDYYMKECNNSGTNPDCNWLQNYQFNVRLIGHERNHIFLFIWFCTECPFSKTFIASYDHKLDKARLIFTQEKVANIINASVNSEQTMIAFAVQEHCNSEGRDTPTESTDVFKSYIAEISPQNRIFSLNIEWRTYQKVQFLHSSCQVNDYISHLLFFHHKESIGLYHIPIVLKDKHYVMSMQPSIEQIIGNFLWSWFDSLSQRLFYVKLYPQDEEEIHAKALLTVVEFESNGNYNYVLNFPLPISFRMDAMCQQALYYDSYFSPMVAAKNFNLEVITRESGSFYVCYQHMSDSKYSENSNSTEGEDSSSSSSSSSLSSTTNLNITYTICCIHGGYKLQCTKTNTTEVLENSRILFIPVNDYVVAYLPGFFLHLLDISCEHEPVHNILLHDSINMLPVSQDQDMKDPMVAITLEGIPQQQYPLVFRNYCQKFYQFKLNQNYMYWLFLNSKPSTRIALLHAAMFHFQDKKIYRKIIERACLDPANIETSELFKEYLICAAYMEMKKTISPLDLKIFPFTSCEVSRGQVERDENGERIVHLFYKQFSDNLVKQIRKVLHSNKSLFWNRVYTYLNHEVEFPNKRFPLKLINLAGIVVDKPSLPQELHVRKTENSNGKVRSDSITSLPVLNKDLRESRESEHKNYVAVEKIVSYIMRVFGKETKGKATNMCQAYALSRVKSISTFWRIVLKSLNFTSEEELYSRGLNAQPSEYELAMFQIIERIKVILEQLCHPGFPGMISLFTVLGFRCLTKYQFLEYFHACLFDIDADMARRIVLGASDTPENVAVKMKLVSLLSKEDIVVVLKEWGNTHGNRLLAHRMLSSINSEDMHGSSIATTESNDAVNEFVPIRTLLDSVKSCGKKTGVLRSRNANTLNKDNLQFLSDTVLSETEILVTAKRR